MDKKKFDVDFLTYENKEYFYNQKIKKDGGRIVSLTEKESSILLVRLFQRWKNLYKLLRQEKYDVFHCNCDFSFKFIELFIAKMAGVKVRICHSHNSAIDTTHLKGKISYIIHILFRPLICKYATQYLACSKSAAEWLYGKHIESNKIIITNNGIDVDWFDYDLNVRKQIRDENFISDNEILIGNIGRFTTIKNQKYIIDIVSEGRRNGHDFSAMLIGDGETRKSVEEYAKLKNIDDKIYFIGITPKVKDYLMAFDCFVMPSIYEGLPVSGIEAQATGLLCFFSDTITKELNITSNVHYLSIKEPASIWVDKILEKIKIFKRISTKQDIIKAGYDINQVVKNIEKIYQL